MWYSIRWRLVLSYMLLTLLTVSVVGFLALSLIGRYTHQQEIDYLTLNTEAITHKAQFLFKFNPRALSELAHTSAFLSNIQVKVLDEHHQVLVDTGPHLAVEEFWIAPVADVEGALSNEVPFNKEALNHEVGGDEASWQGGLVIFPANRRGPHFRAGVDRDRSLSLPLGGHFMVIRRQRAGYGHQVLEFDEQLTAFDDAILEAKPPLKDEPTHKFRQNKPLPPGPYNEADSDQVSVSGPGSSMAPNEERLTISRPIRAEEGQILGYVEVSGGPIFRDRAVSIARRAFLWAGLGATCLAVIMGLGVSRGLTAPLQTLTQVTKQMGVDDLSVRAPIEGRDEVGQLAGQINQMAQRLEISFTALAAERDALRRFIADASHELRTPITALKNFNELLQGLAQDDPIAQAEFLAESETQIQRLSWITHNLLDLSRLDAGLVALDLADCHVAALLETIGGAFQPLAKEKQITLTLAPPDQAAQIRCDQARIELALSNLLGNALKFTPSGGHVDVGAQVNLQTIEIWVQDTGPGIAAEEQAHLFERFYRGRQQRQIEGSGLGLAIVQSIVQAHQGQVWVESRPKRGSRFVIRLPRFDDETKD